MSTPIETRGAERDRGAVLPLVLIVSLILGAVVVAVTTFGVTNLRYSEVTERRSDQLAAADAAMSYGVNLVELRAASCIFNDDQTLALPTLADSFNGATGTVECSFSGGGLDSAALFAMVLTGEGLAPTDYLVRTQSGGVKEIGGPVFMETVDTDSFSLTTNNGLLLDAAPLVHYDPTLPDCVAISEDDLPADLEFVPDEIYGPICSGSRWFDYGPTNSTFDEPNIDADFSPIWSFATVPPATQDGGSMQVFDGTKPSSAAPEIVPLTSAPGETRFVHIVGGYQDDVNGCRVFEPGRYITPPDTDGTSGYFKSGDYLLDFREAAQIGLTSFDTLPTAPLAQSELELNDTIVTAGKGDPDPNGDGDLSDGFSQLIANPDCAPAIAADTSGEYGATFYFARSSHLALNQQAVVEIMPRDKGVPGSPLYVSVHALCDTAADPSWCTNTPADVVPSDRQAPGGSPGDPALVWIKAGNNSEIVANGLIYAPRAEMHFKNVSNDAEVRIRGGMVVARATIDASASAENFEIGVGSQDVDVQLRLTATGTDARGKSTVITSDVEFAYDEVDIEKRLEILSWRVCETTGC